LFPANAGTTWAQPGLDPPNPNQKYKQFISFFARQKKKPYNNINLWRYRHKGGDISASTRRQAYGYVVVRRAGEAEKAEYDPRARSSIITSFVPRYAKLYVVYIQGWWAGKQKPYGSKMEKFDVVGRSSRCSQSTDKHFQI
jgi:hypothetical protein